MVNIVYRPIADPAGGEAVSGDHASCGRLAAASILRTYAVPIGLNIPDNANATQIAIGINAYGHGFHAVVTAWGAPYPQEVMAAEIPKGHWVIIAVWCTSNAEPIPSSQAGPTTPSHWLSVYQINGTCFNCWEQTFPTYPNLDADYHGYGSVIVWHDAVTPTPLPTPQGASMASRFRPTYTDNTGKVRKHEYYWPVINPDKTCSYWFADLDDLTHYGTDNIGGVAGGPASCWWSDDGQIFVYEVIGSDGTSIERNVWRASTGGKFDGWSPSSTKTLQLGSGSGSLPSTAQISGTVNLK